MTSGIFWTIRTQNYFSGLWTWGITAVLGWRWVIGLDVNAETVIAYVTIATGVIAIVGYLALRLKKSLLTSVQQANDLAKLRPVRCLSRFSAVVLPLADLSLIHFATFAAVCYGPSLLLATYALDLSILLSGWLIVAGLVALAAILFRGLDGTTNWPAVTEELEKAGYNGFLTFKYFHPYIHYPEALIWQTSDSMDRILGRKS